MSWSTGGQTAVGKIVARDKELWLESDVAWPILQTPGRMTPSTVIVGEIDDGHFYLSGKPYVRDGAVDLLVEDFRVGVDDPHVPLRRVSASFDYVGQVVRGHPWDGALRAPSDSLTLPTLDGAPSMSLTFVGGDVVQLEVLGGAAIQDFETQLDALQRLITFAAQHASVRGYLRGTDLNGRDVDIYRGVATAPRPVKHVDYRDFPLRLGRANTQAIVDAWWDAMASLRPIPHLLSSLRNQPGFREADFLFLATAVDRLSETWVVASSQYTSAQLEGLKAAAVDLGIANYFVDPRPTFAVRAEALASTLSDDVWGALKVDRTAWLASLRRHRNLVAHSDEQRPVHRRFLLGDGLRALLASTDAIVTLIVAKHLGVDDDALVRAAQQQRIKRILRFAAGTLELTNEGIVDRPE